jgi:mannitol/fructose-specific phosphotransferase system IIA component
MPIVTISSQDTSGPVVTSTCIECLAEQTTPTSALQLGIRRNAHAIALPPCACGAQELLHRTFDVEATESRAGHRKAVNALAEHLKSTGRIHPDHVATIKAETVTPTQIGTLIGDVPPTSLPHSIVTARNKARVAAANIAPDPVAIAGALLAQAQVAFAAAVKAKKASPSKLTTTP